jgi:flagellar assembly protein FliH
LDGDVIFKIHLNPQDIEILKEVKSTLLPDSSALEKVELTANNSVERGSCVLETSVGDVDARLKSQLEKIEGMLKETIRNTESDTYFPAMELEDFDKHDSGVQNL